MKKNRKGIYWILSTGRKVLMNGNVESVIVLCEIILIEVINKYKDKIKKLSDISRLVNKEIGFLFKNNIKINGKKDIDKLVLYCHLFLLYAVILNSEILRLKAILKKENLLKKYPIKLIKWKK